MAPFTGSYQANKLWYGQAPFQDPEEVRDSHAKRFEHILGTGCTGRPIQDNGFNFHVFDFYGERVTPTNVKPADYEDSTVITRMGTVQQPRSQQPYQPTSARRSLAPAVQTPRPSQHGAMSVASRPQAGAMRSNPRAHAPNYHPYQFHPNGQMGSAASSSIRKQQSLGPRPPMMHAQANTQYTMNGFQRPPQQQYYVLPRGFQESHPMAMTQAQHLMPVQMPYGNTVSAQGINQAYLVTPQQWPQQGHFPPLGDFQGTTPSLTPSVQQTWSNCMPHYGMTFSQCTPQAAAQQQQQQNVNAAPGSLQQSLHAPAMQQGVHGYAPNAGMMSWPASEQSAPGLYQQQPQQYTTSAPGAFQQGLLASTPAMSQNMPASMPNEVTISGQAPKQPALEAWEQQAQELPDVGLNEVDMPNLTPLPQNMQGMQSESQYSVPPPVQTPQQTAPGMQDQQQSEIAQTISVPFLADAGEGFDQAVENWQLANHFHIPESEVSAVIVKMENISHSRLTNELREQQALWRQQATPGTEWRPNAYMARFRQQAVQGTGPQMQQQNHSNAILPQAMPILDDVPMPEAPAFERNAMASAQPTTSSQDEPVDLTGDQPSDSRQQAGGKICRNVSRPPPINQQMSERGAGKRGMSDNTEPPQPAQAMSHSSSPSYNDDEVLRRRANEPSTMRAMSMVATYGRSHFRRPRPRLTAADLSVDDEASHGQEREAASQQAPESDETAPQPDTPVQRRRAPRAAVERSVSTVTTLPPTATGNPEFESLAARVVTEIEREAALQENANGCSDGSADDNSEVVLENGEEDLDGPQRISSQNVAPSSPPNPLVSLRDVQYQPDIDYSQREEFADQDIDDGTEPSTVQEGAASTSQEDGGDSPDPLEAAILAEFAAQEKADRKQEAAERRKAKKAAKVEARSAAREANDSATEIVEKEQSFEEIMEESRGMKM